MRLWLVIAATATASTAVADIDNKEADRVFKEALALRDVNPVQACAKFVEALRFNPQAITIHLNVALCDEKFGRIASAFAKFTEIADRAQVQNLDEYAKVAKEHLARLQPDIPYVTITLAEQPSDLRVVVDDKLVPRDKLVRLPIDPGERTIVVSAPGRVSHIEKLVIGKAEHKTIAIPILAHRSGTSRRAIAKLSTVGGAALAATGLVIGLVARSRYLSARDNCPFVSEVEMFICNTPDDLSAMNSAKTLGNVGSVVGIAGVVVGVTGGLLWWRSNRTERSGLAIGPSVDTTSIGLAAAGRF